MTLAFVVERFQRVDASAGMALLRLTGTWAEDVATDLPVPELVIYDGHRSYHVAPLPDPDGGTPSAGPWRAAFPVPREMLDNGPVALALSAGRAGTIELPRPPSRLEEAQAELDRLRWDLQEAVSERETAEADLARLQVKLEQAVTQREAAAAELERLRGQLTEAVKERDTAQADLDALRTELDGAASGRGAPEAEPVRLRTTLDDERERLAARLKEAEARCRALEAELEALTASTPVHLSAVSAPMEAPEGTVRRASSSTAPARRSKAGVARRRRQQARWLPSERAVGVFLVVAFVIAVVLLLSNAAEVILFQR